MAPWPMGKICPVAESFSDCRKTRDGRFSGTAARFFAEIAAANVGVLLRVVLI